MSDLERTGVELFVDGLDSFRQGMGEASGLLTGLGAAALDVGGGALDALGGAMSAVADVAAGIFVSGVTLAASGIAAFTAGVVAGAFEAEDAQVVINRLGRQLIAMGDSTDITIGQVEDLAQQFAGLAGGSDDVVIGIQQIAIQSQAVSSGALPDFIQASLDLGAVLGDTTQAATIMALAYDQPSSALAKLKRAHILFTPEQEKQIKAFEAAGNNAAALAIVQGVLADVTAGAALESTQTLSGAWGVFTATIGESFETMGAIFLPLMQEVASFITATVVPAVVQLGEVFAAFGAALLEGNVGTGLVGLRDGLAGVFGPEIAGMITTFLAQAVLAIQGFVDLVESKLPAIQMVFENVFAHGLDIVAAFAGFFTATLLPAIQTIWASITEGGPTANEIFVSVLLGIQAFARDAEAFIVNVFIPALTNAVDWVVANWPTIQATIESVFAAISNVINTVVLPFINDVLIPTMQALIDWVVVNWPTIQATIITIMTTIQTTVTTILANLQQFWNDHGAAVMTIVNTLWSAASTAFTVALEFIQTSVTNILNAVRDFWAAWGDEITTITTALFNFIGTAFELWATLFTTDWGLFAANLLLAWQKMWDDTVLAMQSAIASITSIDWNNIGQSISQGIANGIGDGAQFIIDAAHDAAMAAFEAAKRALGIQSPSLIFMNDVAGPIMEGWAAGIDAGASRVIDAIGAVNDMALSTIAGNVNAQRVSMLPVPGGNSSTVNNNITQYNTYPRVVSAVDSFTNIRQGLNAARA